MKNSLMKLLGLIIIISFFLIAAIGCELKSARKIEQEQTKQIPNTVVDTSSEQINKEQATNKSFGEYKRVEFGNYGTSLLFSGLILTTWEVENITDESSPTTQINIYDPLLSGSDSLEKSQIFIKSFEADSFLTLRTVNVLSKEETLVHNHPAVKYEIVKKDNVPQFKNQPSWRSKRHKLIDIKYNPYSMRSTFYVFSYNPALKEDIFMNFIDSLTFYNDVESYLPPIDNAKNRISKKPFRIYVTAENSPLDSKRFHGYHTGTDFEIFEEENEKEVIVKTICGGELEVLKTVEGYGGVAIQRCQLGVEEITVLYGHLDIQSIDHKPVIYLAPGESLGVLGNGFSEETDGERKHLHLGIYTGYNHDNIDFRGYVDTDEELKKWLNPEIVLKLM